MPVELFAFMLTLLAGLATGIGSAIAFFARRTDFTFLSVSLGFSAGVMLYVSFIEIFPSAHDAISAEHSATAANWITVAAFFGGILLVGLIDFLVPDVANPHEYHSADQFLSEPGDNKILYRADGHSNAKLMRMGLFTAAALALHNFPEGFATFLSALQDPQLGVLIAVAIAIHNIPEGIAVSLPIYYATGSRWLAFRLSFLSGLSEPLGALIGWLILRPFITDTMFGIVFAAIGGIMVYISLDELLPTAEKYGKHHHAILGLIAGMAVMALSLLML